MERSIENFVRGDVISVPFPFSNASATKKRPALVVAESDSNNIIVCPITSKPGRDYEIKLEDQDFRVGQLNLSPCYIVIQFPSASKVSCKSAILVKSNSASPRFSNCSRERVSMRSRTCCGNSPKRRDRRRRMSERSPSSLISR